MTFLIFARRMHVVHSTVGRDRCSPPATNDEARFRLADCIDNKLGISTGLMEW